jgi:hypothetical protein
MPPIRAANKTAGKKVAKGTIPSNQNPATQRTTAATATQTIANAYASADTSGISFRKITSRNATIPKARTPPILYRKLSRLGRSSSREFILNKLTGKYSEPNAAFSVSPPLRGADGERNMKKLLVSTMAAALVISFAVSAEAAGNKQKVSADVQASCKAQAAKKYSAIHFLKRLNFVNNCIAQYANAKTQPKAKAIAAGEPAKPTTTGKAPKRAE